MNWKKVEAIEAEVASLDKQIAALQALRESVLLSDEEYASYVEHYQAYYDDEPLSIRKYYEFSEEHFEAVWQKHQKRLAVLERLLAA